MLTEFRNNSNLKKAAAAYREKDYERAYNFYKKVTCHWTKYPINDMFLYAMTCKNYSKVHIKKSELIEILREATNHGHLEASYQLALMLMEHRYHIKDLEEAKKYMKTAVDNWYPNAEDILKEIDERIEKCHLYDERLAEQKRVEQAKKEEQKRKRLEQKLKLAAKDSENAKKYLDEGERLYNDKQYDEAIEQLKQVKLQIPEKYQDDPEYLPGFRYIGKAHRLIALSIYKKNEKAEDDHHTIPHWLAAADHDDGFANGYLGDYYRDQKYFDNYENDMLKFYKRGAELGDPNSLLYMGLCYEKGYLGEHWSKETEEESNRKAAEWIEKAAEKGNARAQWLISLMYSEGTGVPKDINKSNMWYAKAAAQGWTNDFQERFSYASEMNSFVAYEAGMQIVDENGEKVIVPRF